MIYRPKKPSKLPFLGPIFDPHANFIFSQTCPHHLWYQLDFKLIPSQNLILWYGMGNKFAVVLYLVYHQKTVIL
jgi:hypothetical protein